MKKLFIFILVVCFVVGGYDKDVFLYAKKLILGEPTNHTIQKGEYLSLIAKKYYGKADYWRELALINRAPNSDLVFPDEEIIVPSKEVIEKIRKTRRLSVVNNYVKGEEEIIARLNKQAESSLASITPEPLPEPEPMVEAEQQPVETDSKSSTLYIVLAIIGIAIVAAAIAFILYRRKKQAEQISIIDDIDFTDEKEESEPEYQEYPGKKDKKEVLVS